MVKIDLSKKESPKKVSPKNASLTKASPKNASLTKASPKKASPKLTQTQDWKQLRAGLANKMDYQVRYYFVGNTNQDQRHWVARAFSFFNGRSKREGVPTAAEVNANLNNQVGGYLGNMTPINAPVVTFKTAKHIFTLIDYLREERANHGQVDVRISVDDAPYFPVL